MMSKKKKITVCNFSVSYTYGNSNICHHQVYTIPIITKFEYIDEFMCAIDAILDSAPRKLTNKQRKRLLRMMDNE